MCVCVRAHVRVCLCVSISVIGCNIGFKDRDKDSLSITAVPEVVFQAVLVQISFCPHLFSFSCLKKKSAVQYANVLFFKKCYCTVNIIVNIFVSS